MLYMVKAISEYGYTGIKRICSTQIRKINKYAVTMCISTVIVYRVDIVHGF